jgi:UDP-N-acetylmuramoyl-L-alanyl-D-glutamate--2,6-diaminopimelate ligase
VTNSDKLGDLLRGIPGASLQGDPKTLVTGISCDSRRIARGDLFAAIPGAKADGAAYIPQALAAGAAAVLTAKPIALPAPTIVAPDVRLVMGCLAARLFDHPDHRVEILAVTGTNGKTTITYLLESILAAAGLRPAVIGTVNYRFGSRVHPSENTTPESLDILRMVAEMEERGATHVILEVSSHALHQRRVSGLRLRRAIFTNLTRDHLDYHRDLEDYFQAKRSLFSEVIAGKWACDAPVADLPPLAVLNLDNESGRRLMSELGALSIPRRSFGLARLADVRAKDVESSRAGIKATVISPEGRLQLHSPLVGAHNLENILAAVALTLAMGIDKEAVEAGVAALARVPGRLEPVANAEGFDILVDYAHTPDALAHAVATCRDLKPNRLIAVFGCGGDRDRGKRPVMGRIAVESCDFTVVTSDNPRTEDPLAIVAEILAGIEGLPARRLEPGERPAPGEKAYLVEPDRRAAIRAAVRAAAAGDLILIAGKGHEDYQLLRSGKIHFDDREEAAKALKERNS